MLTPKSISARIALEDLVLEVCLRTFLLPCIQSGEHFCFVPCFCASVSTRLEMLALLMLILVQGAILASNFCNMAFALASRPLDD